MVCSEKRFHPPDFNGLYHNILISKYLRYFRPVSYGKSGVDVVTINVREDAPTAQDRWDREGFDLPIVMNPNQDAFIGYGSIYNAAGMPFSVVDRAGQNHSAPWHHVGASTSINQDLQNEINALEPLIQAASGPEIDVLGNNESIADGDTTPNTADHTDFGSLHVDGGHLTQRFTIRNTGADPLRMIGNSPVEILGPHASDFMVTRQPASTIAPGTSITFNVRLTGALSREVNDQVLSFRATGNGSFEDLKTGAKWNLFGKAVQRTLAGEQLIQIVSAEHF